ncbi:MAG: FtsX-like permease family protein, partial [Bryobacteraceae bacterium]
LNPDLFVTASEKITRRDFLLPATIGKDLASIEGIQEVQAVRSGRILLDGSPIMLVAVDVAQVGVRAKLPATEGEPDAMYRSAAAGEGVIISDTLAQTRNYHLGRVLTLASPSGVLKMPVVGVVIDFSDQQGSVILDREVYRKHWKDDRLNILRVFLAPGVDVDAAKRRILNRFAGRQRLFVLTNTELKTYILKLTDQWFGITYVQIAVAVLVAILGIVNTLTVSITDRRRELGVLQAVGALRMQIRRTIWMEAFAIGVVGLALGLVLGAMQLYYSLQVAARDLGGIRLSYEFPAGIALVLLPAILLAAFIAAVGPAEAAVRGSLVEALEYE